MVVDRGELLLQGRPRGSRSDEKSRRCCGDRPGKLLTVQFVLYNQGTVSPEKGRALRRTRVAAVASDTRIWRRTFAGLITVLTLVFAVLCLHVLEEASSTGDLSSDVAGISPLVMASVDDEPAVADGLVGCAVAGLACVAGLFGLLSRSRLSDGASSGGTHRDTSPHPGPILATRVVSPARPSLHALNILRT